jgi:hypothetical protein
MTPPAMLGVGAAGSAFPAALIFITQGAPLVAASVPALFQPTTTSPPSPSPPTSTTLPTSTTTSTSTTTPAAPLLDVHGAGALWFIGVVIIVVAILGFAPTIVDAWRAADWRTTLTEELRQGVRQGRITISDLPALLRAVAEPRGVRGLTRSLIALLIVVLAAFALTATALSGASDAIDLRKTIVTSLLTVLATVAGFYFGSRTAQTSAEDARQHTGGTPAPQGAVPTITEVDPRQALREPR